MEISAIPNELLQKASKGDMGSFEEIYRASSGFVYNVALRVTRNPEDAEEAVQDVFLKLYEGLKSFKFQSSFKTWLYRIAVNTALNIRKKTLNSSSRRVEYDENIANDNLPQDDSVEKSINKGNDKETVDRLLGTLNEDYRVCLILREIQGLSYEEISKSLDININTVRTRIKRAREILMKEVMASELR